MDNCSFFKIISKGKSISSVSQVKNARKRQVEEEREEEARKIQRKERCVFLVCKLVFVLFQGGQAVQGEQGGDAFPHWRGE